ncbi:MAG: hypothetical protein QXP35_03205, partial [Candidatus Micrarchaeaceae archaeon]
MKNKFSNESTYKKFLDLNKEAEFDKLFNQAIEKAKQSFGSKYPMHINGKTIYTQEQLIEQSPIDRSIIIGYFQKANRDHAKQAIEAASSAFEAWASLNYKERAN